MACRPTSVQVHRHVGTVKRFGQRSQRFDVVDRVDGTRQCGQPAEVRRCRKDSSVLRERGGKAPQCRDPGQEVSHSEGPQRYEQRAPVGVSVCGRHDRQRTSEAGISGVTSGDIMRTSSEVDRPETYGTVTTLPPQAASTSASGIRRPA